MPGQLDKTNQIAALSTAVAVEEIFPGIDVERRPAFRVQRTESDELGALTGGPAAPILLPQIIEQRKTLFEFFQILAHGAVLASGDERRRRSAAIPRQGWWGEEKFSQRRRGQRTCRTGVSTDNAKVGSGCPPRASH